MCGRHRHYRAGAHRRWSRSGMSAFLVAAVVLAMGIAVWRTLPAEASDAYGMRACDRLGASIGWPPAEVAASVWAVARHARTESIREHAERLYMAAPAGTRIAPPGWERLLINMIDACLAANWQPPTADPEQ